MAGLPTFFGNPVSSYADHHLDLVGVGKLLALSPDPAMNVVAGMRYRTEFGDRNIYTLLAGSQSEIAEKHQLGSKQRGHTLFTEDMSYSKFASLLSNDWQIRETRLTEEFGFDDLLRAHDDIIPLFAISPKGRIEVMTADTDLRPEEDWKVLSLTGPRTERKKLEAKKEEHRENAEQVQPQPNE